MPLVKIKNKTSRPLNLALSIVVPIHFTNGLLPEQTWEIQVGSVWFRFECRQDDGSNRYSVSQSAITLGLFGLTGASIAAVGLPLAITGLAPLTGSSCAFLTGLAGKPLIAAAATPEVLALTTWIATNLTKKTIYQIASEQGLNKETLEKTLQDSSTILDGIKFICLSASTLDSSDNAVEKIVNDFENSQAELEHELARSAAGSSSGFLSPEILDRLFNLFLSKSPAQMPTSPPSEPDLCDLQEDLAADPSSSSQPKASLDEPRLPDRPTTTNLTKFQSRILKLQRLATFKKKSEAHEGHREDDEQTPQRSTPELKLDLRDEEQKDEEWELIEKEVISNLMDRHPRSNGEFNDQGYTYLYSNKTVYIGFNNLYQFEWHLNPDVDSKPKTKFRLIDKST